MTEMIRDTTLEREALRRAAALGESFLAGVAQRPVGPLATADELRAALGGPLPESGIDPVEVIEDLARGVERGLVGSVGPRFFGFVIGGGHPAAVAADWLTSVWDQNAGLFATSPAASVAEEVAAGWLVDVLGLPAGTAVGFVTGCQMANFAGIAAGRHAVLRRAGWDVEDQGLQGAPLVNVVLGGEAHVTIFTSLRMLGLGGGRAKRVAVDGQGRMRPDELARALAGCEGPTIVCAQAGNVNTGAFDPLDRIAPLVHERGGWLHVDGAFGLWAAASPERRGLLAGVELADSWATDGHKWLNVPYDSGLVAVADASALRSAMTGKASYLIHSDGATRDPFEFTPEFSRRARGFATYAALRSLGRRGVAELVDRCCRLATRMAERLRAAPEVRVLNEVVLNQVLVRFEVPGRDADALTRSVVDRVQRDGTCWLSGTHWQGLDAMRVSISNWSTTEADIDRSADAIVAAVRSEREAA
jgi:glutamate/tyrosine decarboxylase-like PLP-dependent enzyme